MAARYQSMAMITTMLAIAAPASAFAGPISKWDTRAPDYRYVSSAKMFDVERCLIDTEGWPASMVYRQPDRPDIVTIIYVEPDGKTRARIDLVKKDDGLHVTAWAGPKAVRECAPEKS